MDFCFQTFFLFEIILSVVVLLQKHVHRCEASNDSSGFHNSASEEEEEEEAEGGEGEGGKMGREGQMEDGGSHSEGEGKVISHTTVLLCQSVFSLFFQPPQKKAKRYMYILYHCLYNSQQF